MSILASVAATLLAAAADGVAPAILLSIKDAKNRTLGQYMFNAPEGISRLMLEHKTRPGLQFKALFLSGTSAAEAGGLGGLVLRFKQDGIASFQLIGPRGTSSCLSGIQSFISWKHPLVAVTEPQQQQQEQRVQEQQQQHEQQQYAVNVQYADRHIQVVGFGIECSSRGSSSSSSGNQIWQAPPWLSSTADLWTEESIAKQANANADALMTTGTAALRTITAQDDAAKKCKRGDGSSSSSSGSSRSKSAVVISSEGSGSELAVEMYGGDSTTTSSSSSSSSSSDSESTSSSSDSDSSGSTDIGSSSSSAGGTSTSSDCSSSGSKDSHSQQQQQQQLSNDVISNQQQLFTALDQVLYSTAAAAGGGGGGRQVSASRRAATALAQAMQSCPAAAAAAAAEGAWSPAAATSAKRVEAIHGAAAAAAADSLHNELLVSAAAGVPAGQIVWQQQQQQQQQQEGTRKRARWQVDQQQTHVTHKKQKTRTAVAAVGGCCCGENKAAAEVQKQQGAEIQADVADQQQQQQQLLGYICHILPLDNPHSPSIPAAAAAAAPINAAAAAADGPGSSRCTGSTHCLEIPVGQLLFVLYCRSQQQLLLLQQHPAVAALHSSSSRVLVVCHVTDADVARSDQYQQWMSQLRGKQILLQTDQGFALQQQQQQQQTVEETSAGGTAGSSSSEDADLGFRASARVLARLNLISPVMFPLPDCLKQQSVMNDEDIAKIVKAQQQQQKDEVQQQLELRSQQLVQVEDQQPPQNDCNNSSNRVQPPQNDRNKSHDAEQHQQQQQGEWQQQQQQDGAQQQQQHDPRLQQSEQVGVQQSPQHVNSRPQGNSNQLHEQQDGVQQQQQQRSSTSSEFPEQAQPAAAAAATNGSSCFHRSGVIQQLQWKGLILQDTTAAAAAEYEYEWQKWADPDYDEQQQQQQQLELLDVYQLQQELLTQRPKLQQLLPQLRDKYPVVTQQQQQKDPVIKQQQQQQQDCSTAARLGSSTSGSQISNKLAAQALRHKLAHRHQQQQQQQQSDLLQEQRGLPEGGNSMANVVAAPSKAAGAPAGSQLAGSTADDDGDLAGDEPTPVMLTQPWAADTSVILLGTGSAEPSKYRGPSAILLKISPNSCSSSSRQAVAAAAAAAASSDLGASCAAAAAARWVLLDAGEGTLGAIRRHMGPAAAAAVISYLGLIWISHKHADHMLGVPRLLEARSVLIKQQQQQQQVGDLHVQGCYTPPASNGSSSSSGLCHPVLLVGPRELLTWLRQLPGHTDWQDNYHFVPLSDFRGAVQLEAHSPQAKQMGQGIGQPELPCGFRPPAAAASGVPAAVAAAQQGRQRVPPPRRPSVPPPQQQSWQQQQQQLMVAQQQQQQMLAQQRQVLAQQQCALMWRQQCQMSMLQQQQHIYMLSQQHMHMQQWKAQQQQQQQQQQYFNDCPQIYASNSRSEWPAAGPNSGVQHAAIMSNGSQQHFINNSHHNFVTNSHHHHQQQQHQQRQQDHSHHHQQFAGNAHQHHQQQQQPVPVDPVVQGIMFSHLGFTGWQSVPVHHCAGAHGIVLKHKQGWKLVYSGDTRPCPALVSAGAGATLLIHEATFETELSHHARAKRHSTLDEALQVAKDMGAYRTVLTHFSQRYPRLPAGYPADAKPWRSRPLLAVDGAVINFALLPVLPALMPVVAAALEELEEDQDR